MSNYDPRLRESAIDFPATATRLGMLERRVVSLSRRDTLASLAPRGRGAALMRRLFGLVRVNGLADPKLETRRRYAVQLRHGGDALAAGTADTLVGLGYTVDQIAHARWLVARERHGAGGGRGINRVALACMMLMAVWIGMLAADATADRVVGLVIGLLFAATAAPLLSLPRRDRLRVAGVATA